MTGFKISMRGLAQISSKPKPVFTSERVNLLIISFTYDTVPLKLGKYNEGADYRTLPWGGGGDGYKNGGLLMRRNRSQDLPEPEIGT